MVKFTIVKTADSLKFPQMVDVSRRLKTKISSACTILHYFLNFFVKKNNCIISYNAPVSQIFLGPTEGPESSPCVKMRTLENATTYDIDTQYF